MGIVAVIARAKKSVRTGGLPGVVEEFGGTLRSRAIPAPLRPAASRIADLLRVPDAAPSAPVSLVDAHAPHAVDRLMQAEHGGVCPFTGNTAGITTDAAHDDAAALAGAPVYAELAQDSALVEAAVSVAAGSGVAAVAMEHAVPEHVAPELSVVARDARSATAAGDVRTVTEPVQIAEVAVSEQNEVVGGPASGAKAKEKEEKVTVEVAAKPNTAKTAPRSNKNSGGKPGNKKHKKK